VFEIFNRSGIQDRLLFFKVKFTIRDIEFQKRPKDKKPDSPESSHILYIWNGRGWDSIPDTVDVKHKTYYIHNTYNKIAEAVKKNLRKKK
jgi:hypothetical protein